MKLLSIYNKGRTNNLMSHEGDLNNARKVYLAKKNYNLIFLLESRFSWMNQFIDQNMSGIELGSGIAASKDFIKIKNFLTTDFNLSPWIDIQNVNALSTPFQDSSKDFIIASNMIHHLAKPTDFFNEARRILKPGGLLLIQEVHTSIFMRIILRLMHHEGYNEQIDVFNRNLICNDPDDLWSANNSIPKLLFQKNLFEENYVDWKIIFDKKVEFLTFLNSGGVTAKTFYIPLPLSILKFLYCLDNIITKYLPEIFALQRQIVIKKSIN